MKDFTTGIFKRIYDFFNNKRSRDHQDTEEGQTQAEEDISKQFDSYCKSKRISFASTTKDPENSKKTITVIDEDKFGNGFKLETSLAYFDYVVISSGTFSLFGLFLHAWIQAG